MTKPHSQTTPDDAMDAILAAAKRDRDDAMRRIWLWEADCAAHVLPIFETRFPDDKRPRLAIQAKRRYARGEISRTDWLEAQSAAMAAGQDAGPSAAGDAARTASGGDIVFHGMLAVETATRDAAIAAAEHQWQRDRLVARMRDPEPADWPLDPAQSETTEAA